MKAFTANNYNVLFKAKRFSSGFNTNFCLLMPYFFLLNQLDSVCHDQSFLVLRTMKNKYRKAKKHFFPQKNALCISFDSCALQNCSYVFLIALCRLSIVKGFSVLIKITTKVIR